MDLIETEYECKDIIIFKFFHFKFVSKMFLEHLHV